MNTRGQSLVGVLVSAALMAIVATSFMVQFKSQSKASRQLAAMGGAQDLSQALSVLFDSPACATTGLLAAAHVPPVVAFSKGGVPVSVTGTAASYTLDMDTIKFSDGTVAISTLPNAAIASMIQPHTIASVVFTALGGASPTQFPFLLEVKFATPSGGPPPKPLRKFVTVYTNGPAPSPVVGACSGGGGNPSVTTGNAAGGWSATASITLPAPSALVTVTGMASGACYTGGAGTLTAGISGSLNVDGASCTRGNSWSTGVMNASFSVPLSCTLVVTGAVGSTHSLVVSGAPYGDGTPSCSWSSVSSSLRYTVMPVSTY